MGHRIPTLNQPDAGPVLKAFDSLFPDLCTTGFVVVVTFVIGSYMIAATPAHARRNSLCGWLSALVVFSALVAAEYARTGPAWFPIMLDSGLRAAIVGFLVMTALGLLSLFFSRVMQPIWRVVHRWEQEIKAERRKAEMEKAAARAKEEAAKRTPPERPPTVLPPLPEPPAARSLAEQIDELNRRHDDVVGKILASGLEQTAKEAAIRAAKRKLGFAIKRLVGENVEGGRDA